MFLLFQHPPTFASKLCTKWHYALSCGSVEKHPDHDHRNTTTANTTTTATATATMKTDLAYPRHDP